MQFLSHELIYFFRAIAFGVVVGYAFFYFFLYFKVIIEDIIKIQRIDVDLWWILTVSVSIVMGVIGALLLM
ncbi:MAG: hypothetical protein WC428_03415 [Candidatus Paceibacterota bacterium]